MDINATQYGIFILISALVICVAAYYLGRRKTETPKLAAGLGFLLGLIPLLGIIYLVVLMLKQDITSGSAAKA